MVKNMFLAAAATLILAAAAIPVSSSPALACHGCWKAAKAAHPGDWKAQKAYKRACRAHYKAMKKAS